MSDNEVEDDSFLPSPGHNSLDKRVAYEPTGVRRYKQIVCTKTRAALAVACTAAFVLLIAFIAAFAQPGKDCSDALRQPSPSNASPLETTTSVDADFPWKSIRLPRTVLPESYDIFMHPNLTTFKFSGSVDIVVRVTEETNFIVLHTKQLNISKPTVQIADTHSFVSVVESKQSVKQEQYYLRMEQPLAVGNYLLRFLFDGVLSDLLTGFYRSSYKTSQGETRWLATTQFQPTDARMAFPCFDEPDLKANFTMSIVREKRHRSLFNMPQRGAAAPFANGLQRDFFQTSVKMSTYLVAFVVCDYASLSQRTPRGTNVSVYAPEEQINQTKFALKAASKMLEYYESFFGLNYPLPKLDLIAIPDFAAGAMENWGLVTYRMVAILYDENHSGQRNKQWVATVVSHELAHQWFGNLVTIKWWSDLWLNEGFASFVEYLGVDYLEPDWKMRDQFVVDTLVNALQLDSLSSSHPISVEVKDPAQINEIFDSISYDKGASLVRMLESCLGSQPLKERLQRYLDKYKYKNAVTRDLWYELTEDIKDPESKPAFNVWNMMRTWTLQMGFPVLTVTRKGTEVTVSQSRYLLKGVYERPKTNYTSPYNYRWYVPVTYLTERDPRFVLGPRWLRPEQQSITFELPSNQQAVSWIKVNANMTGYYRVCYDQNNWEALIQQLRKDLKVFTDADRANLIDDVFALVASGHLNSTIALDLTRYLEAEREYVPWSVAINNLATMGNYLIYNKRAFDLYKNIGWSDNGAHLRRFLRARILFKAVYLNHEKSVQKAKELFDLWMNGKTEISANLKSVIYRAGVMYGGEREWNFVWKKYKKSLVPSEKRKLLQALASTRDGTQLKRFLDLSLQPEMVRKQDTVAVVTHVASNPAGRDITWSFLKQNWEEFYKRYGHGSFDMASLCKRVCSNFHTEYHYNDVKSFFASRKTGSGTRAVQQALEEISMNMYWYQNHSQSVIDWLEREVG